MANSLSAKIKLLTELAPLLLLAQQISTATSEHDRALLIIDALQFLAGKTATTDDDEALEYLEKILRSSEGTAFFSYILTRFSGTK